MPELNASHFLSLVRQINSSSFEAAHQLADTHKLIRLAFSVQLISPAEYESLLLLIAQKLSRHKSFPGFPTI